MKNLFYIHAQFKRRNKTLNTIEEDKVEGEINKRKM